MAHDGSGSLSAEWANCKADGGFTAWRTTELTRESVAAWISSAKAATGGLPIFQSLASVPSSFDASVGSDRARMGQTDRTQLGSICTHTLRRTKTVLIYRRTKSLRAVQLLSGDSKLESTVRYLGIEVDGALEMAEQTEV